MCAAVLFEPAALRFFDIGQYHIGLYLNLIFFLIVNYSIINVIFKQKMLIKLITNELINMTGENRDISK